MASVTEDLDSYLNVFGVTATFGAASPKVIFDRAWEEFEGQSIRRPICQCKTSDFSSVTLGTSTIVISGTTYVIEEVHPDGTGWSTLVLREQ